MARSSDTSGNDDSVGDVAGVDDIADELYALPADEFVAARNDRVKAARAAGARDVAAAIARLAKPSAAAWLANQLARAHPDDVRALVELGAAMREATEALDRDELRRLSTQQRQRMASLVGQAREVAEVAGVRPNDASVRGLEDILHAALAEPDAADELTAGRLTGTLRSSGFPSGDLAMWSPSESTAAPPSRPSKATPAKRATTRDDTDAAQDERRRALTEAAAAAEADRDAAHADLERADQAVRDARAEADRVRRQLDEAVDALTAAEQERRGARTRAEQADRAARLATRRLDGVKRR
jgi:hypothetical protein